MLLLRPQFLFRDIHHYMAIYQLGEMARLPQSLGRTRHLPALISLRNIFPQFINMHLFHLRALGLMVVMPALG